MYSQDQNTKKGSQYFRSPDVQLYLRKLPIKKRQFKSFSVSTRSNRILRFLETKTNVGSKLKKLCQCVCMSVSITLENKYHPEIPNSIFRYNKVLVRIDTVYRRIKKRRPTIFWKFFLCTRIHYTSCINNFTTDIHFRTFLRGLVSITHTYHFNSVEFKYVRIKLRGQNFRYFKV